MIYKLRVGAILFSSYMLGVMWGWLEHPHHPPTPAPTLTRLERPDLVAARVRAVHFLVISELTREGVRANRASKRVSLHGH